MSAGDRAQISSPQQIPLPTESALGADTGGSADDAEERMGTITLSAL